MNHRSMTVVCNTCRWRSRLTDLPPAATPLTQRCCQDVGPGLTDTCLWDALRGCLQTLTLQYMISQSFLGSARLQLPFSKADGIADNARTVFFSGSYIHITGDEVCYSQHHSACPTFCMQAMQTGCLFCPPRHGQDHCKCRYYNLLLPQKSGIIRRPSGQKGNIRHANVSASISAEE